MYALSLNLLNKTYANGVTAVRNVDLQVKQGDFFALLGPNGTGKSTLINIISSLVNKTSGTVKVFDYDLDVNPKAVKHAIGLVPQELNFNQFETVLDIVVNQAGFYGIPKETALVRAQKYLTLLSLWEKRHAMSRTLSGGMKRRLMIARALMHEPQMLLLDEPTTGIDVELRLSTWKLLKELNTSGVTIILTTHYLEEAEYLCNSIGIMSKGVILEQTTMKDFLSKLTQETFVLDANFATTDLDSHSLANYALKVINNNTLEITIAKTQNLNSVFADLTAANIEIKGISNKTNRLEELFLAKIKGS
jgi:ABC-2 type transport system ATP-binding protein